MKLPPTRPQTPPRGWRVCSGAVSLLAALCLSLSLFLFPALCPAGETSLPPERAAAVLALLRDGAGARTELETAFAQEKTVLRVNAVITVTGNLRASLSDGLRLETREPVSAGLLLTDAGFSSWTASGGDTAKRPFSNRPGAGELCRFVLACLFFDPATLRQHCSLEVLGAEPPVVRLTPLRETVRAYVAEIRLTFSGDGKELRSLQVASPRNGDTVFFLGGGAQGEIKAFPGKLHSAVYTDQAKRLPLLLYVWDDDSASGGTRQCAVFAETPLVRLGRVSLGKKDVAVSSDFTDSRIDPVLERIGEALRREEGEGRYAGGGWRVDMMPLGGTE